MKRNNLIFILTAFVLCLVFALAGCSDNTPDGGDLPEDTTPYYTVTFDSQGGSNVESQKVRQGNPVVIPDVPERKNYSFLGWYKSVGEDAEEWKFATDRVERDITLYAKWQSSEVQTPTEPTDGILIVYFSYSGITRRVANEIISQSNGDGVEIVPSIPYTAEDTNYNDSNSRSQVERRTDARPEISNQTYSQIDMTNYSTVIIGYPIWNGYEPMVIRSFIEHYNGLSGKTVYTFSTAASSSGSTAHNSIKSRCPNADVKDNLHLTSATLLNMQTSISDWLTRNDLKSENTVQSNTVYLTIGNTTLTTTLAGNSATEALKERLKTAPITINMSDYGGWEKVGSFGFSLPTSNEQITAQPCEFVLYQGNQLVIFYGSNSWSYTRLGKIDNITQAELKEILGTGNVTITLSLEKS